MRFHGIPPGSMRFYDVPVNQSVPTEANRGLTSYRTPHILHNKWPHAACYTIEIMNHCPTTAIPNSKTSRHVTTQARQEIRIWRGLAQRHMGVRGRNRNLRSIDTYRSCTKGLQKTAYLHLGDCNIKYTKAMKG
jgi:hypothetical protein